MKKTNSDIDCVFDGFNGKGGIYISNFESACLKQMREGFNIKAVISIATMGYVPYHEELIEYLYIPAQDTDVYEISKHFQQTFDFLEKHRKNGNVLVHCMVGKSRSATIVAAYLLKKFRYSLQTVMNLLQRRRKIINPNPGFMKQLQDYCKYLGVQKGEYKRNRSSRVYHSNQNKKSSQLSLDKSLTRLSQMTAETQNKQKKESEIITQKIEKIKQNYINCRQLKQKNRFKKLYHNFKSEKVGDDEAGSFFIEKVSNNWNQTKSVQLP